MAPGAPAKAGSPKPMNGREAPERPATWRSDLSDDTDGITLIATSRASQPVWA